MMSFGIAPSVLTFHSIYSRDDSHPITWTEGDSFQVKYKIYLQPSPATPFPQGYRNITQYLWENIGHELLQGHPEQQLNFQNKSLGLFDTWQEDTWHRYS